MTQLCTKKMNEVKELRRGLVATSTRVVDTFELNVVMLQKEIDKEDIYEAELNQNQSTE